MKPELAFASSLVLLSLTVTAGVTPASRPAPTPRSSPGLRLVGDSLVVPMESWQGRSVVQVTIDGHGPFPFVLDTGAGGSLVTKALADSLRLPVGGETQVGSPLGGRPVPAKIVHIGRLGVGEGLAGPLSCVAVDMPMPGPQKHWGVLSPNELAGLLVTWDFPNRRFVFRRGALPAPDDRRVFSYESDFLPTVPVEIAGRRARVHLDSGAARGLMLPVAWKDSLPLAAPPIEGPRARSVDRDFTLLTAKLAGTLVVAGREFVDPELSLSPAGDVGNIGVELLRGFEVTLDPLHRRLRMQAATAPGSGDLAGIAPGLPYGMVPLPGLATGGMPRAGDFAAFARAGYRSVVDLCMPGEPRGFDEKQAVAAAGLVYVSIPFTRTTLGPAQFDEIRRVLRDPALRPAFVHCVAANRVGGILLPWLVLDEGLTEEEAVALAHRIGLRSPEMEQAGLEYLRAQRDRAR